MEAEIELTLPVGFTDDDGVIHRDGALRPATLEDIEAALADHRVNDTPSYMFLIILARIITRLGGLRDLTPKQLERMAPADLEYLRQFALHLNTRAFEAVARALEYIENQSEVTIVTSDLRSHIDTAFARRFRAIVSRLGLGR